MDWLSFILGTLFGGIGCVVAIATICCAAYWWAQREGAKAREAMRFDMARRSVEPPKPQGRPPRGGSGTQAAPPKSMTPDERLSHIEKNWGGVLQRLADDDGASAIVPRRVLLSVSDKTGLIEFARVLQQHGVELISTGGTRKAIVEAGLAVRDISELTEFPEILDGRVKTLHPRVHGGILALRDNPEHVKTLAVHGILPIDLVVCNLYPFESVACKSDTTVEEIVESIDVGGLAMARAAAKNYRHVAVVTDPTQYAVVMDEINVHGGITLAMRQKLAAAAFARTAAYDAAIWTYLDSKSLATQINGIPITKWDDPNVTEPGYIAFLQMIADAEKTKQPSFIADNI